MALLPMFLTLLPLSAPGALAPQDLEADLATLRRQRDDAEAEVVVRIADAGTRTAAEGLVELYEGMASVWMRREILRALPRFDGKADAEQVAFDHLFTVGRTTEDPILREAALTGLADAPRLGRGYLARIVESPSADGVRVRAMELHVLGAVATDAAWYGEQFEPQRRVDAQPEKRTRRRRKAAEEEDAPPEEIVHVLPAVRALAFPPIARQFDDARLLEMVRSERMALVRSALLRELEQRGPKELAELAPELMLLCTEPFPFEENHRAELAELTGLPVESILVADGEYLSWHGSRTPDGIDYAVESVINDEGTVTVELSRRGDFPMPQDVELSWEDGSTTKVHIPLVMMRGHRALDEGEILGQDWPWVETTYTLEVPSKGRLTSVTLDPGGLQADIHRDNNTLTFDLDRDQEARQSN